METKINDGWEFCLIKNGTEKRMLVDLPHDWAIAMPFNRDMDEGITQGFLDRWGIGIYRKNIYIDDIKPIFRYFLRFDGIYENSSVKVNGRYAGGRKYGYSGFSLDVTDFVVSGENQIEVTVDNSTGPVDRWYSGCGIYRNVYFEAVPQKHIDRSRVRITSIIEGDEAAIDIETGTNDEVSAEINIGGKLYRGRGSGQILLNVRDFTAWSAETPVLYDLKLVHSQSGHSAEYRIGIRDIKTSSKGLFINGKSTKLKGVCVHQDAGCFGTAVPKEIWRQRLAELKKLGCNAIRPAHHIFMPEFLDLCDELGFYVYEECFDKWTGGSYGRYYKTEWKRDIEAMVTRDRNHPSIIIWGIGNEVEFQGMPQMLELLKNHCKAVKEYDATRPVTCALHPHFKRIEDVDISTITDIQKFVDEEDENVIYDLKYRIKMMKNIAEVVDVFALNYQEPWFRTVHEYIPDKAIISTEAYQYFSGYPAPGRGYSEKNPWQYVMENDCVIGEMIWTGFDYIGESMGWPSKGWSGALFHTNVEPRFGAYIMKSHWSEEPFVQLGVMDYSLRDEMVKEHWDIPRYVCHWDFPHLAKTVVPYAAATNCDEVAVSINGKKMFTRKRCEFTNGLITGFVPYEKGVIEAEGLIGGKAVCRHKLTTAGIAVKLEFDKSELVLNGYEGRNVMLTVRAKDAEGTAVFRESARVRFCAEGDAEITGVDNGDILISEPYKSDGIHLFRGKASVAVKIKEYAQRVKITAYADGMQCGECVICDIHSRV